MKEFDRLGIKDVRGCVKYRVPPEDMIVNARKKMVNASDENKAPSIAVRIVTAIIREYNIAQLMLFVVG